MKMRTMIMAATSFRTLVSAMGVAASACVLLASTSAEAADNNPYKTLFPTPGNALAQREAAQAPIKAEWDSLPDDIKKCLTRDRIYGYVVALQRPTDPAPAQTISQCQKKIAGEQAQQASAPKEAEVIEWATRLLAANPSLKEQCYEAYKDNLDDPSSFQLGKDLGSVSYRRVGDSGGYLMDNPLVYFTKVVRQKNQFGALIAYGMTCYYTPKDGALIFNQVRWSPMR